MKDRKYILGAAKTIHFRIIFVIIIFMLCIEITAVIISLDFQIIYFLPVFMLIWIIKINSISFDSEFIYTTNYKGEIKHEKQGFTINSYIPLLKLYQINFKNERMSVLFFFSSTELLFSADSKDIGEFLTNFISKSNAQNN